MSRACPMCPDGNLWGRDGPTGKACPVCKGEGRLDSDDEDNDEAEEVLGREWDE